ncbi:MAG: prevent-host-death protein [Streptococcaceae bacterium]|jgi:prevent-host-death family protein|nr:prevent-host-death protein [Streptococcaceae bacterium]
MEYILPVSDLRSYNQTLHEVNDGNQVILTKNGHAKYAVVDFEEWQRTKAEMELFTELQKGELSAKYEPLLTLEEVGERLGLTLD